MASRSSTSSATAAPRAGEPDSVVVGVVHRAHGIRGEVAVEPLSDVPGRLAAGSALTAVDRRGGRRELRVASARPHQGLSLVTFEEVADRDAAEALRGATLEVALAEVPPPPAGAFYQFQLVGCRCRDAAAGELGLVTDLVDDGGGQILVVSGPAGEVLVPFVERFIRSIDLEARSIELELPPGLIEACASGS